MMYKSQFQKIDLMTGFVVQGHIWTKLTIVVAKLLIVSRLQISEEVLADIKQIVY